MKYAYEAESLLKKLISIKSFSFYEDKTADYIENWLCEKNIDTFRSVNNIYAINKH